MLEVLAQIDVLVEDDFTLEVIPIKYGKVEEIYATLSSVIGLGDRRERMAPGMREFLDPVK